MNRFLESIADWIDGNPDTIDGCLFMGWLTGTLALMFVLVKCCG